MSQDLNDYVNGKVQKAVSDTMKAMSKREEPFMNFIRGSDEIDTSAIFDAVAIDFEGQRQAALKALSKTEAGQKCLAELARLDQAQHQAGMDAVAVAVRQQKDPMGLF